MRVIHIDLDTYNMTYIVIYYIKYSFSILNFLIE